MIIYNEKFLRQKSEVVSVNEGKIIADKLLKVLNDEKTGVGLAAPQIGILKQVAVIKVKKDPIILINPQIIESRGKTIYVEECLSFPGKTVKTQRYVEITVKTDNHKGLLYFCPDGDVNNFDIKDKGLLESIVAQHEISHLSGQLMFDYKWKGNPITINKKYGRNQKINIKNIETEEIIKQIKYKKAENYLNDGWKIIK